MPAEAYRGQLRGYKLVIQCRFFTKNRGANEEADLSIPHVQRFASPGNLFTVCHEKSLGQCRINPNHSHYFKHDGCILNGSVGPPRGSGARLDADAFSSHSIVSSCVVFALYDRE